MELRAGWAPGAFAVLVAVAASSLAHAQQPAPPPAGQEVSFKSLIDAGFEVKATALVPLETVRQVNPKEETANMVVTLQRGAAVATCYVSFAGYVLLTDPATAGPRGCRVRWGEAGRYDFVASGSGQAVNMFRIDRATGEVGYCAFGRADPGAFGQTVCAPAAKDAQAPGEPGPYALMPHRRADDNSIFRVNLRTGAMSICFPRREEERTQLRCTPFAR